ncbi:Rrf2 family transcriptional regulator [Caulobacter sp. S45]|jgi:DNA-binding IscR family transcriptional regulator|uniref:Rrf2 family transcriptional regulator n=1 Tax=Caulobacter sp. S45 TaxID=1641861 RepID=UPI00131E6590|nr:Rrf2 family transcriptional regulator [Caulobacter sp. S45]
MSDSQRFPVAAHALAYLAHSDAFGPERAVSSAALAASMPTNPVVVRRVTAMLARFGLIATRTGASGGAWLLHRPQDITLDEVLEAVGGCASMGCPPPGAKGCPVGERIPEAVRNAIKAAERAASERLSHITVADLLRQAEGAGPLLILEEA